MPACAASSRPAALPHSSLPPPTAIAGGSTAASPPPRPSCCFIGTGAFAYVRATDPARQRRRQGPGSAARAYDLVVEKNNFVPAWTCQSDDEFAQYAREHTGEGWHVVGPENLKLVGWTYVPNELTENTTVPPGPHSIRRRSQRSSNT